MIIFVGLSALTVQGIVAVRLRIAKKNQNFCHFGLDAAVINFNAQILVDFWGWPIVTSTDVSYQVIRNQIVSFPLMRII